jgi:hypothetical protein
MSPALVSHGLSWTEHTTVQPIGHDDQQLHQGLKGKSMQCFSAAADLHIPLQHTLLHSSKCSACATNMNCAHYCSPMDTTFNFVVTMCDS